MTGNLEEVRVKDHKGFFKVELESDSTTPG